MQPIKIDVLEPIKRHLANLRCHQKDNEAETKRLEGQWEARANDIAYLERAIEEAEKLKS